MKWTLVVAAVGVTAVLLLVLLWLVQDRLIFFPQPLGSTLHLPGNAQELDIVTQDGVHLHGWLRPGNRTPAPVVLYFGGNAEEVSSTLADARWPADWSIVAVNYRGYGRSEGQPGEKALVADALALYDAIALRDDVQRARIVVFGRSLGTGVAVNVAASRSVAGVILASPYDSIAAVGRGHYPWLPIDLLLKHPFDVRDIAARIEAPLLVLVADSDAIIPVARSRALYDLWRAPKAWHAIAGTDHNTVSVPDGFWGAVRQFLEARAR